MSHFIINVTRGYNDFEIREISATRRKIYPLVVTKIFY